MCCSTLLPASRHGYGIMQDVEALTDGALRLGPGTLYTAIKRLVNAGLIEECEPDADRAPLLPRHPQGPGRRRGRSRTTLGAGARRPQAWPAALRLMTAEDAVPGG